MAGPGANLRLAQPPTTWRGCWRREAGAVSQGEEGHGRGGPGVRRAGLAVEGTLGPSCGGAGPKGFSSGTTPRPRAPGPWTEGHFRPLQGPGTFCRSRPCRLGQGGPQRGAPHPRGCPSREVQPVGAGSSKHYTWGMSPGSPRGRLRPRLGKVRAVGRGEPGEGLPTSLEGPQAPAEVRRRPCSPSRSAL